MSGEPGVLGTYWAATRTRAADLAALTKPRLNLLVLMAVATGFYLGSTGTADGSVLFHALLGTFLVAAGASVLNQVLERDADARMRRTANRPLPAGRVSSTEALALGVLCGLSGTIYLALATNRTAAGLAALTLALYVGVYTPLKRWTPLNTVVGAFPGALPTLIGWAAAGKLDAAAGTLFAIVFLWQMPHFFAIAWLYREEYARAGFQMLPVVEPSGRSTGWRAVLYGAGLVPIVWTPTVFGLTGWAYAAGAVGLSLIFLGFCIDFALRLTDASARRLFLYSVLYLPVLLALMAIFKTPA